MKKEEEKDAKLRGENMQTEEDNGTIERDKEETVSPGDIKKETQ